MFIAKAPALIEAPCLNVKDTAHLVPGQQSLAFAYRGTDATSFA